MSDNDEEIDDTKGIDDAGFKDRHTNSATSLQQTYYGSTLQDNGESSKVAIFDRGPYESIFENIEIYDYKPIKEEAAHEEDIIHKKVLVKEEDDKAMSSNVFVQSNPTATHFKENTPSLSLTKKTTQYSEVMNSEEKYIEEKPFPVSAAVPSSFRGLEINCNTTRGNGDDIGHPQHEIKTSPKEHHFVQGSQMPPLCENSITTPTLSIQFSPFLTFSEDRVTNSIMSSNHLTDVSSTKDESTEKIEVQENDDTHYETDIPSTQLEYQPFSTASASSDDVFESSSKNQGLTYADSLLLDASQGRIKVISTPTVKSQRTTPKASEKKRKSSNSCRSSRQPQKRFSIDLHRNEIPGGDLFVNKRDGRVRLTTNLPRQVEAIDPSTGSRTHIYASCSEASRVMGINRTRMSRSKLSLISTHFCSAIF